MILAKSMALSPALIRFLVLEGVIVLGRAVKRDSRRVFSRPTRRMQPARQISRRRTAE